MKEVLEKLFDQQKLSRAEAKAAVGAMLAGECAPAQIAAFLAVFRMRPISVPELQGFRDQMLESAVALNLDSDSTVDICGTGGDGKNTFNISTLSAFVVAGAGQKVIKHGNYGVSSACGSSNVLEALGVPLFKQEEELAECLEKSGICFLHGPNFHPAMKEVAPVRKELGQQTFFNLLGPLSNPAQPTAQFLGVSKNEFVRLYAYLLEDEGVDYSVAHSYDGYDEISLTGTFKVASKGRERVFEPAELGFAKVDPTELGGGSSVEDSAKIFLNILDGQGTQVQNEVVVANAGFAISAARSELKLEECFDLARRSLTEGAARNVLGKLSGHEQ